MFMNDEVEYIRLKRSDNLMGWIAILFVGALVFMFAGLMNSASASNVEKTQPAAVAQSATVNMGSLLLPSGKPAPRVSIEK